VPDGGEIRRNVGRRILNHEFLANRGAVEMYDIILLKYPGSTAIAGAKRRTMVNFTVIAVGFAL
jgi:hypothetical protein